MKRKQKQFSSTLKGFSDPYRVYELRVKAKNPALWSESAVIPFKVQWMGSLKKTEQQAYQSAVAIWGVIVYPEDQVLVSKVKESFGVVVEELQEMGRELAEYSGEKGFFARLETENEIWIFSSKREIISKQAGEVLVSDAREYAELIAKE